MREALRSHPGGALRVFWRERPGLVESTAVRPAAFFFAQNQSHSDWRAAASRSGGPQLLAVVCDLRRLLPENELALGAAIHF